MGLLSGVTDALGLTDSGAAEASMKKAEGLTKEQMKRLDQIDLPDIDKMKLALENPELVGLLDAESIDDSSLEDIQLDQGLRENQLQALQALKERSETGLTASDKFEMEKLLGDVDARERSQRASIDEQMQRQGMGGSGASLVAKLQNQQNNANQARERAMQMAAQAQQNKMSALSQLGSQSANMQNQDFNRQSQIASAKDEISRANAMNRQNVNAQNIGARQAIENQRASTANQQQSYNKGLQQQQFQNQIQKTGLQNQASGNMANMYQNQAGAQSAADAQTMGAITSLGAAAISDVRVKTDIEEGSSPVREMLDNIKPYKYDYKDEVIEDPSMEGDQLGVMAQDLEASDIGDKFVQEDEMGTKRVDYGKMGSTQMAAIADVHHRLKALEKLMKGE